MFQNKIHETFIPHIKYNFSVKRESSSSGREMFLNKSSTNNRDLQLKIE